MWLLSAFVVVSNSPFCLLSLGGAIILKGRLWMLQTKTGPRSFDKPWKYLELYDNTLRALSKGLTFSAQALDLKALHSSLHLLRDQKEKKPIALALVIDYDHLPAIAPNLLWPRGLWPFRRPLQTDTWKEGRGQGELPSGGDWNQKPHQVRLWSHLFSCWRDPPGSSGGVWSPIGPPASTAT